MPLVRSQDARVGFKAQKEGAALAVVQILCSRYPTVNAPDPVDPAKDKPDVAAGLNFPIEYFENPMAIAVIMGRIAEAVNQVLTAPEPGAGPRLVVAKDVPKGFNGR